MTPLFHQNSSIFNFALQKQRLSYSIPLYYYDQAVRLASTNLILVRHYCPSVGTFFSCFFFFSFSFLFTPTAIILLYYCNNFNLRLKRSSIFIRLLVTFVTSENKVER
jgi:hypothetical protein